MTSHLGRLYAVALVVLVFFVAWALVSNRPWAAPKPDPRIAELAAREQRIRRESVAVKRAGDRRWRVYRAALAERNSQIAARRLEIAARQRKLAERLRQIEAIRARIAAQARTPAPAPATGYATATPSAAPAAPPPVRVVTLPALTVTRSS